MNIEKLAKHLQEFTLDEIEMIAEYDCKKELEQLLNIQKLVFEQGVYKYITVKQENEFHLFTIQNCKNKKITVKFAFEYFLENYAKYLCKHESYRRYKSTFNYHLLPYLKNKFLNDLTNDDIIELYSSFQSKNLPPKTMKNYLSLLNQVIKYFQNLGIIDRKCIFQVKRLTNKNKFTFDRIIFEK